MNDNDTDSEIGFAPGKDDLLDLDTFEELDEFERLLRDDNLEAVIESGDYLTTRHSEICACFGSRRCLEYMVENDMPISSLLNLYAVVAQKPVIVNVPHDDELYLALSYNYVSLGSINKPTIDTAIETLYKLSADFTFALKEAIEKVRALYTDKEWCQMKQRSVLHLIEMDQAGLLGCTGHSCIITQKTYKRVKEMNLISQASKTNQVYQLALKDLIISRHNTSDPYKAQIRRTRVLNQAQMRARARQAKRLRKQTKLAAKEKLK